MKSITDRILSIDSYEHTLDTIGELATEKVAWISITDVDQPFVCFNMPAVHLFHAQFPDGQIKPDVNILTELVGFIIVNENKKFVINCMAGISRSSAIARAVHCILDYDGDSAAYYTDNGVSKILETYFYEHNKYPNSTLYNAIIFHYNKCFKELKKK